MTPTEEQIDVATRVYKEIGTSFTPRQRMEAALRAAFQKSAPRVEEATPED